jgi:hypothetical protein
MKLAANRLDVQLVIDDADQDSWHCIYATAGAWTVKTYAKPLIKDIVSQSLESLKQNANDEYSYIHLIARTLDLVHPTHQLQAQVLAYPLYGSQILRKRLVARAYYVAKANDDVSYIVDAKTAIDVFKQIEKRLEKELRTYFEFIVPYKSYWRVGLALGNKYVSHEYIGYPGENKISFGFDYTGKILHDGKTLEYVFVTSYVDSLTETNTLGASKILGVIVDLYKGNIHLVVDGKIQPAAFGGNALAFSPEEREFQKYTF